MGRARIDIGVIYARELTLLSTVHGFAVRSRFTEQEAANGWFSCATFDDLCFECDVDDVRVL